MGRRNTSGFVYVEADPPLKGLERKRDYRRQYMAFWLDADPSRRERQRSYGRERFATDPEFRKRQAERCKAWKAAHPEANREHKRAYHRARKARQLAVAREYGATL